jgi:hypothetical protein
MALISLGIGLTSKQWTEGGQTRRGRGDTSSRANHQEHEVSPRQANKGFPSGPWRLIDLLRGRKKGGPKAACLFR